MTDVPRFIDDLTDLLAAMPGVVAVTLGGSRATGAATPASDWDVGVYYRGAIDTAALEALGEVHRPGAWGRIMNGGAWLTLDGARVDVLLRDLDIVDAWSARAREGVYEVDALLGYVAGVPTYSLLAERAIGLPLRGELPPAGEFPPRLADAAPSRWRFHVDFSLMHARMRADKGDVVGAVGQVAKAVTELAHALLCERRTWVLNEKRIVEAAGLHAAHAWMCTVPAGAPELVAWVDGVNAAIRDRSVQATRSSG
jgi:hypothetical protein